jgi:hypothetical protein
MSTVREPHPIARARERYGIDMNIDELRQMEAWCKTGKGRLTKLLSGDEHHLCDFYGMAVIAVYMPSQERIVTILPRESCKAGNSHSPATRFKATMKKGFKVPKTRRKRRGY